MIRFLTISFFLSLLQACGANPNNYKEVTVKEYRLFVDVDDEDVKAEFRSLVDMFNAKSCMHAISYTEDKSQANSIAVLTKGLQRRDGKVGWGQWVVDNYQHHPHEVKPGERGTRTLVHSMNLEFDLDYVYSRLASPYDQRRNDLFKLFSHEVGHGLTMSHTENKDSVMYPDISGEKNFADFFTEVRAFFGQSDQPDC